MASFNSVKFIPKRLSQINFEEPFFPIVSSSSSPKITNNYQINLNQKFDYVIKKLKPDSGKKFDFDRITNIQDIKFKNEFQIKYDTIITNFGNLKLKSENISEINKYKYNKYWEKVINCVRNQSFLYFQNKQ